MLKCHLNVLPIVTELVQVYQLTSEPLKLQQILVASTTRAKLDAILQIWHSGETYLTLFL